MGLSVFNYGANAVCFEKNGRKYGMICAWATQVDYEKNRHAFGCPKRNRKSDCQR
jgi:hypothetical protein